MSRRTDQQRMAIFHSRVDRSGQCWNWMAWRDSRGYGQMGWRGKTVLSHRIAAFLAGMIGSLEFDGKTCVLHKCDNPACCNPKHLFVGTQQDNIADMNRKGRQVAVNGDRHPWAKLSNVQFINALEQVNSGVPVREVARRFRVASQSLSKRIHRYRLRSYLPPSRDSDTPKP